MRASLRLTATLAAALLIAAATPAAAAVRPASYEQVPDQEVGCTWYNQGNRIELYADENYYGEVIWFCGTYLDVGNLSNYGFTGGLVPSELTLWSNAVTAIVVHLDHPGSIKGMRFYDRYGDFFTAVQWHNPNIGNPRNDNVTGFHPTF